MDITGWNVIWLLLCDEMSTDGGPNRQQETISTLGVSVLVLIYTKRDFGELWRVLLIVNQGLKLDRRRVD